LQPNKNAVASVVGKLGFKMEKFSTGERNHQIDLKPKSEKIVMIALNYYSNQML
jgi:hypothetical protein